MEAFGRRIGARTRQRTGELTDGDSVTVSPDDPGSDPDDGTGDDPLIDISIGVLF